ncbi:MAG: DHH family phosphoesterase [Elusimicrobia bacterium]|nr:DHH family phosphoesterase [Elusimicrobiota bacterium]
MTPPHRRLLLDFLSQKGKSLSPLLILTHDHPDPDSMASALALSYLAEKTAGIRTRIVYGGIIGRPENRMMAKLLHIPLRPLLETDLQRHSSVALVDTQSPFANNRFPPHRKATLVIDHHPPHRQTQAELAWIDESVGATATLLVEALKETGLGIPTRLATALLYGISSETQGLGRGADKRDVRAYLSLVPLSHTAVLARIQNPSRPRFFFVMVGKAIQNAFVCRNVIGGHLGAVPDPDIVAQTADFLLSHENMRWALSTARYDGRLHVSLRSSNPRANAGRILARLLRGTAGGHERIAGGALEIARDASEEVWLKEEQAVVSGFLKMLGFREPIVLEYPFSNKG